MLLLLPVSKFFTIVHTLDMFLLLPVITLVLPFAHFWHFQLQVLKFETARQPHILGGSVFGYNDAYRRLHTFLRQWRATQAGTSHSSSTPRHASSPNLQHSHQCMPTSPITQQPQMSSVSTEMDTAAVPTDPAPVEVQQSSNRMLPTAVVGMADGADKEARARAVPYIVSVDVSRAFDNVDADLLLGIVEPLLRSPEYLIIKYTEVSLAHLFAASQHHDCSCCSETDGNPHIATMYP